MNEMKKRIELCTELLLDDEEPFNNGRAGLRVVEMLEAADRSLKRRGKMVDL